MKSKKTLILELAKSFRDPTEHRSYMTFVWHVKCNLFALGQTKHLCWNDCSVISLQTSQRTQQGLCDLKTWHAIADALLGVFGAHQTPVLLQPPQFDEQRWVLEVRDSELCATITSTSYWGWGLFSKCFLNLVCFCT